jgi:hypothetical protein
MERKPVASSNMKSVGYDEIHKLLEIEFTSGEVCTFFNISGEEYVSLLNSPCKGIYFNKFIKNRQGYYLNHIEFHEDLLRLMNSHPAFSKILIEPDFKMNERRISPDIVCQYRAKTLVIEIKMRVPAVISEIKNTIHEMERYAGVVKDAQLVLVIPGMLQKGYVEIFEERGIKIWDLEVIASIFHDQLNLIKGNLLYNLLSSETNVKDSPTSDKLIQSLKKIKIGKEEWSQYQKLLANIFEYIFVPPLSKPRYELSDKLKVNRRDIIIPNYSEAGFWAFLRNKYIADYLIIDAKNTKGIKKEHVLQMANYLKEYGAGHFGIICGRTEPSRNAKFIQKELWIVQRKMIIFLNDNDVIQMLTMKDEAQMCEEVIKQKIEEFRLEL